MTLENYKSRLLKNSNVVDVWIVLDQEINDFSILDNYLNILTKDEIDVMGAFAFKALEKQYLISRALLRYTLSEYEPSINPTEWCFKIGKYGKPFISTPILDEPIYFNPVSYTHLTLPTKA